MCSARRVLSGPDWHLVGMFSMETVEREGFVIFFVLIEFMRRNY